VYWGRDKMFVSLARKSDAMSDVAFIALTIVVFAVLALAVRGVERLIQPAQENALEDERVEVPGEGQGAENGVRR
jgi:hypothetical protein